MGFFRAARATCSLLEWTMVTVPRDYESMQELYSIMPGWCYYATAMDSMLLSKCCRLSALPASCTIRPRGHLIPFVLYRECLRTTRGCCSESCPFVRKWLHSGRSRAYVGALLTRVARSSTTPQELACGWLAVA